MNNQNLISLKDRNQQEKSDIARKGGLASGKAKRERKTFYRWLSIALDEIVEDENGNKVSRKQLAAIMLAKKISEGDLKAIELGLKVLGENFAFLDIDMLGDDDGLN